MAPRRPRILTVGEWVRIDSLKYDDPSVGVGRILEVDPSYDQDYPEYRVLFQSIYTRDWITRWFFFFEFEVIAPSNREIEEWIIAYLERI